jgi:hypothetical protein
MSGTLGSAGLEERERVPRILLEAAAALGADWSAFAVPPLAQNAEENG